MNAAERTMLALLNTYRRRLRLGALTWDDSLSYCATVKLADQVLAKRISHTEASGRTTDGLIAACGIELTGERRYAELLGESHYEDGTPGEPAAVLEAWQRSPDHDAVLRDGHYARVGIATAGTYWVAHLLGEP